MIHKEVKNTTECLNIIHRFSLATLLVYDKGLNADIIINITSGTFQ